MIDLKTTYWLAELNRYGVPELIDGPHSDPCGAEEALTLRKRLPMLSVEGRRFAIATVHLNEPTGIHGPLNEYALSVLGTKPL